MSIVKRLYAILLSILFMLRTVLFGENDSTLTLSLTAFDVASDAASMNLSTSAEPGINDLSPEQITYHNNRLIDLAQAKLYHAQFAQTEPIPEGNSNVMVFRGFEPLAPVTGSLTENVTPKGHKLTMKTVNCIVREYGAWVPVGKWLSITARDKMLTQANKLLGDQAGLSYDRFAREVLCAGTNKLYFDGSVTSKASLTNVGDNPTLMNADVITAARLQLDLQNAPTFEDGHFVCVTHPVCIKDFKATEEWVEAQKYANPEAIYNGEVGRYDNIRFCSTTNAKVERGENFTSESRNFTVKTSGSSATIAVNEDVTAEDAAALKGRKIIIGGIVHEIISAAAGNGTATISVKEAVSVQSGDIMYPGEGGAGGCSVYYSLFIAEGAYGISEIGGHSLEFILHPAGSAGSSDPINQRGSAAWYGTFGCCIIIPQYLVVCMTAGSKDLNSN